MQYSEPLRKLLDNIPGGYTDKGSYIIARCPAHDDTDPSLSISQDDNGKVLIHCHKGCNQANVVQACGLSFSDLFPATSMSAPTAPNKKGKLVATYDYFTSNGRLLFQVLRYESKTRDGDGNDVIHKTFSQRRPKDGGWDYNMKGVQRELYGLLDIFARPDEPVWIVEGEKSADYCKGLGLLATTASGGAAKDWDEHYNTALVGRDVIIVPDHDPIVLSKSGTKYVCVGREHAEKVADSVVEVAKSVHVLELPDAKDKWGLDDWLQAGNPLDLLQDLLANANEWAKGSKLFMRSLDPLGEDEDEDDPYVWDRKVCADIGIHVLGETNDGKTPGVMLYSLDHRKTITVSELSKWRFENLLQFVGKRARDKIFSGNEDCPPDMYRLPEVKAAIASLAGLRSVETSLLGAGAWKVDEAMVLVGPGECAILNGKGIFEQQLTPEYGGHVFDLRSDGSWFDLKYLNELLPMAQDQHWRTEIARQSDSIFRMWNFKAGDAVPKLMTGLVLATWVQSIWNWRPQVFVFGESGCGKTTLFQFLSGQSPDSSDGIFGGLAVASSDYTASAIRQTIGKTSKVVILDEMENSKNRREFLTLARGAGRGATQLRGTTYHRTVSTRLAQIFWCASTETGLDREMDQNRFVVVEMLKGTSRTIRMPPNQEVHQLGQKLLVSMILAADRAVELEKFLSTRQIPNIPGRIVESYAVPAAAYAAVCGMTDDEAVAHLVSLLSGAFEEDSVESDANALIADIMSAQIDVGRGEKMLVSQIVAMWRDEEEKTVGESGFTSSCETKFKDALILQGMRVCYRDEKAAKGQFGEVGLFIATRNARNGILKSTDWATQRIDQKLTRIKGATKAKKKIAGTLPNGVWVPCSLCLPSHATSE